MRQAHFLPSAKSIRGITVALTAVLLSARLSGATTFQAAYVNAPSGSPTGGTSVQIVGNQFQAGATVTVGGVFVGRASATPR